MYELKGRRGENEGRKEDGRWKTVRNASNGLCLKSTGNVRFTNKSTQTDPCTNALFQYESDTKPALHIIMPINIDHRVPKEEVPPTSVIVTTYL
jgi:hypothetical protein